MSRQTPDPNYPPHYPPPPGPGVGFPGAAYTPSGGYGQPPGNYGHPYVTPQSPINPVIGYLAQGYYGQYPPTEPLPSGSGNASMVLGILALIGSFGLIVVAGVIEASSSGQASDESAYMAVGLAIFGCLLVAVLVIILAFVALAQQGRRKTSAVVGLSVNALVVVGLVGLMILGSMD